MLLKTLCDLSMTTWCAHKNQNHWFRDKYLFLTFDRIAASTATLFVEMEHYILFQSVEARRRTLCIHPDSGAFSHDLENCFVDKSRIRPPHKLTYGKLGMYFGEPEYTRLETLMHAAAQRRVAQPRPAASAAFASSLKRIARNLMAQPQRTGTATPRFFTRNAS
jgi:hypothetical protein